MDQSLNPFDGNYGPLLEIEELGHKDYVKTEYSFTKRQPLRVAQGGQTGWKWGPQRLRSEARALKFIAKNTDISVLRLLEHGYDSKDRYYVTMKRIGSVSLLKIGEKCQRPSGVQHVKSGPCSECPDTAQRNADDFITSKVLSQLRLLKSNETGLGNLVLPPPRIVETRERDEWLVKKSKSESYSFVHGDLVRHNIMMCPDTLQVKYMFDWEQAGYYPPEMELDLWRMMGRGYYDLFEKDELIKYEIGLITP